MYFRPRFSLALPLGIIFLALPGIHAQSLSIFSGNGQIVFEQFKTTVPMVAQAKDSSGRPASGVKVTWAITKGAGTLRDTVSTSDLNGLVSTNFLATSLPFGYSFQPATITATSTVGTVNFPITTVSLPNTPPENAVPPQFVLVAPLQTNRNLSGRAGSTIVGAVEVQISSGRGEALPNAGLRIASYPDPTQPPPAVCSGAGGAALSNASGLATCNLVLTGAPGNYQFTGLAGEFQNTPAINLTILPGSACSFSLSASSQSFASTGGPGSVNVATTSGCSWTAASNAAWITITSGSTGNGAVNYSVAANDTGAARVGTMLIAGQIFTVNQSSTSNPSGTLGITTTNLPSGAVASGYSATLTASGGTPPYTWSVSGPLPPGLTLNASTGAVIGTPTAQGSYVLAVNVADSAGASASRQIALSIVPQGSTLFAITTASFPNGVLGQPYQQGLSTSGGCVSPFQPAPRLTLSGGVLPAGLAISQVPGGFAIAGTPSDTGTFNFMLQAKDACGNTVTSGFTIVVTPTAQVAVPAAAPSSLSFTWIQGSAAPPVQTISVTSSGSTLSYAATASTNSGGNWLAITGPSSGTTPGTLAIGLGANYTSLGPAAYTGSVTITPQGAAPLQVSVTLNVVPAPMLSLAPSSISATLSASPATPAYQQNLVILSSGATVPYTVSVENGDGWLSVTPTAGTTPGTATVILAAGNLKPGDYSGTITVTPVAGNPIHVLVRLTVTPAGPLITAITNAASFLPGAVSPGEILVIYGSAMGPDNLATLTVTGGLIDTMLAGTRVLFDDLPAPMIYTSAQQLSVIVPVGVVSRPSTKIKVEYQGLASSALETQVVPAKPGIFTLNAAGQGAILNQDYSVNSARHPAAPDSIVFIYATGGGLTNPPGKDGTFAKAAANTVLMPAVKIDGLDAEVLYAGAAPALPTGALQVNVRVPKGVHPGASVPVLLSIGEAVSQSGVTLTVAP